MTHAQSFSPAQQHSAAISGWLTFSIVFLTIGVLAGYAVVAAVGRAV